MKCAGPVLRPQRATCLHNKGFLTAIASSVVQASSASGLKYSGTAIQRMVSLPASSTNVKSHCKRVPTDGTALARVSLQQGERASMPRHVVIAQLYRAAQFPTPERVKEPYIDFRTNLA